MLLLELLLFFNFGLASEFYYNSATHQTANLFEKVRVTSMDVSKCLPSFIATVVLRALLQNTILCGLHSHPEKWGSCSPCFRHGNYALDFWIHPKFHSRYQTPQTSDSAGSISVYLYTPSVWPLLLETCLPPLPGLKDKPWKSNWPAHGQPKDDGWSYNLGLCQTKRRLLDPASTNHYLIILCFPEASMA